jgi:hypothetical protein
MKMREAGSLGQEDGPKPRSDSKNLLLTTQTPIESTIDSQALPSPEESLSVARITLSLGT